MTRPTSTGSSRSSSRLAAALVAAAAAVLALSPAAARACAGGDVTIAEETTFDPHVLGEPAVAGLFYDPYTEGYGGACEGECARTELLADWATYLPGVKPEEWSKILFEVDLPTLDGLIFFLQGKKPAPSGWERSSLAALPREAREKVVRALFLVGFARRIEPFGAAPEDEGAERWARRKAKDGAAAELQRNGEKSFALAKDPFLRQRYAFLLLRLRFYRQDWSGVVAFSRANAAALEGPGAALRWRARYYLAGAHWRAKRYAEANLELARVAAAAPALAGGAVRDFHPMEDADWQRTLALAASPRERAWLWALVGVTRDGSAAMAEIAKLDASSRWLPLLAVREVNRLEGRPGELAALERACADLAARKETDRPWILDAVAGHAAALRGDLAAARARLERAVQRAPADAALLRTQARASLALALARSWRPGDDKIGEELVRVIPSGEGQIATARGAVRRTLAAACEKASVPVDAELFQPSSGPGKPAWREQAFVEAIIARTSRPATSFERFMVEGSGYTPAALQLELARLHLVHGQYTAAGRALDAVRELPKLGTDPFVMHVVDCHDCDHEKYAEAPWTLRSYAERLAALEAKAQGEGAPAVKAAFDLGAGLYNLTWSGNARAALEGSHQEYPDTAAAERWFRTAYERAGDRELKARAAAMAAKCELAREGGVASKTWYPALRALAGTAYEKEVLAECGWYRDWRKGGKGAGKAR